MNLQLKQEFLDTRMTCPFTGKIIDLAFLEKEMYQHYYNIGHHYLFEETIADQVKKEMKKHFGHLLKPTEENSSPDEPKTEE